MKKYLITSNDADQRLDKFLKKLFPNSTLSFLYKLNRKGNIKVFTEGKKTKQDNEYKLKIGDEVQVFLSDADILKISQTPKGATREIAKKLSKKEILYEDNNLLIINKSPGQNVHPGDHKSKEISLIEQAQDYLGKGHTSLTFKPSLIHRIDRDTSGIILVAKTKKTLVKLSDEFKKPSQSSFNSLQTPLPSLQPSPQPSPSGEREQATKGIRKTYFCIVLGKLSRSSGTIRKKLKRIENAKSENKVQVSEKGLEAITHYKVLDQYKIQIPQGEQVISTLEVQIETGRMHQIRVHMEALGNPILGDRNYGDKKLNAYFAKNFGISRQMLHAWKIEFQHPEKKKKMSLEARLKKDMSEFISKIASLKNS